MGHRGGAGGGAGGAQGEVQVGHRGAPTPPHLHQAEAVGDVVEAEDCEVEAGEAEAGLAREWGQQWFLADSIFIILTIAF